MHEPIAITGLGITCALGANRADVARACREGTRPFAPVRRFDASAYRVNLAAEVPPLDTRGRFGAGARNTSRTDRLALWAAADALEQAQVPPQLRQGMGVFVGASSGGMQEMERGGQGYLQALPFSALWAYPVWATARCLARVLALGGPRATYMTACSSAAHALGIAMHRLRRGELEVALAGGAESVCRLTLAGFGSLGVLDPEGARPFSAQRKGITLGEGSAFFVLEPLSRARRRGAPVLAILAGYGSSADAHHMVHPQETGAGALEAMHAALRDARLEASAVDYVNAHGTGTVQNDAMEVQALARLFEGTPGAALSSSKGMIGHTLGACAAVEAALVVLGMTEGFCPPNAQGVQLDPMDVGPCRLVTPGEGPVPRVALSSSFAFGGNNAALVFSAAPVESAPPRPPPKEDRTPSEVVITGAAVSSARGTAHDTSAIANILTWPAQSDSHEDLELQGLDPAGVLGTRAVRRMDPLSAHATALCTLALQSAQLEPTSRLGVSFGTSFGALEATHRFLSRLFQKGPTLVNPLEFPNLVHNAPAGYAGIQLGAAGASVTCCQEELSADEALRTVVGRIRNGTLRAGLCAGGDLGSSLLDAAYARLSRELRVPTRHASVLGALVLESAAEARARGAIPWARVVASTAAGPRRGLLGVAETLRDAHGQPPDLWLTSALGPLQEGWEAAAARSPWLAQVPRINARARLGNAGGAGAAAVACGAAAIATGRAQTVLVTSVTLDGAAHGTLLSEASS